MYGLVTTHGVTVNSRAQHGRRSHRPAHDVVPGKRSSLFRHNRNLVPVMLVCHWLCVLEENERAAYLKLCRRLMHAARHSCFNPTLW